MRKSVLGAFLAAALMSGVPASAVTISNTPDGGSIATFGVPDTLTYGQVFTAPVSGTLSSFTLWLNGAVGEVFGGVGTWNGGAAFEFGAGSPVNLYESADVSALAAGPYTFSPNVSVTAGSRYVAYISVFDVAGASGTTTMPQGSAEPGLNYFVWNNSDDPRGNVSWNYFSDLGNAQFSATFDGVVAGVPEPATWGMMLLGFGLAGAGLRRARKQDVPALA